MEGAGVGVDDSSGEVSSASGVTSAERADGSGASTEGAEEGEGEEEVHRCWRRKKVEGEEERGPVERRESGVNESPETDRPAREKE